jgi:nucleoside-diphosphate-sugar epimerase
LKILVIGAAGVIGSALTEKFLKMGLSVNCMDICRFDEAWRLNDIKHQIKYTWKASNDLLLDDIREIDVIVDGGLGVADRPLGNSSPTHTLTTNLYPSLRILETINSLNGKKPIVIYPSSFNALYGYPNESKYNSQMLPNPSSLYGWTKAAVELLYMTYHKSHGIPYVITRVGSGYGARMRSDELPARLILNVLTGKKIIVKSPNAKRFWTYGEDIIDFYGKLIENLDQYIGQTLHCAGNKDNEIVTNISLAKLITKIGNSQAEISSDVYEPGELVDGKPISFDVDSQSSIWNPQFTLEEGMKKTFSWFEKNLFRYS